MSYDQLTANILSEVRALTAERDALRERVDRMQMALRLIAGAEDSEHIVEYQQGIARAAIQREG